MSPIGGVGINLAVQDAVAAARILAGALQRGQVATSQLRRLQRRRTVPTVVTQAVQRIIQRGFLRELVAGRAGADTPAALKLLARFPVLQIAPARFIGVGILPEHIPQELRTIRSARE